MINYYEELPEEEKIKVTQTIQTLYKQTFLLERKYDKRLERFTLNQDYLSCTKHIEFIKEYFQVMGIDITENTQLGIIYICGEQLIGDKIPKLATLYLLVLKLMYDELMMEVSSSSHVYVSISEIHEKLASYRLLSKQPSPTDIRRTLALLRKHQIIEPLDVLEELEGSSRIIVYPTVNAVLFGDDIRALLDAYKEGEDEIDDEE